jgi:hypothetical protein
MTTEGGRRFECERQSSEINVGRMRTGSATEDKGKTQQKKKTDDEQKSTAGLPSRIDDVGRDKRERERRVISTDTRQQEANDTKYSCDDGYMCIRAVVMVAVWCMSNLTKVSVWQKAIKMAAIESEGEWKELEN